MLMNNYTIVFTRIIFLFLIAGINDVEAGIIDILAHDVHMTIDLEMTFPPESNVGPWTYNDTYTYKGSAITTPKLYGEHYPGKPTGFENSSWFYGYSQLSFWNNITSGNSINWEAKAFLKQHDEPNPAVNSGAAYVNLDLTFLVYGKDISYWSYNSSILDVSSNQYIGPNEMLIDGHSYLARIVASIQGPLDNQCDVGATSEFWLHNIEFINVVPESSSLLFMGTGLLGIITIFRKRQV